MNLFKGIFFLYFFYALFSCDNSNIKYLKMGNTNLSENDSVSGWDDFPLKLEMDSGKLYIGYSQKSSEGYYQKQRKYILFDGEINKNLKQINLLSKDELLMNNHFNYKSDIVNWIPPSNKEIKIGHPIFLRNYDDKDWCQRIFFDKSKKSKDNLMSVSLIVDPSDFFNYNSGIYVQGVHGDSSNVKKGNYSMRGQDWEKQTLVHFFNKDGGLILNTRAGIKIHGNLSRAQPQKSFKLSMKKKFGAKPIEMDLFGENQILHRLILRTPFTSAMQGQSVIMDSFIAGIAIDIGLDAMKSRPCHVYLNGEYWGIYHLREKIDEYYFKEKYQISKKSIDIVEFDRNNKGRFKANHGSELDWISLMEYLKNNNISKQENFKYVSNKIDINNLIDYLIIETFFGNKDWPGNNYKVWKSSDIDNKWRFIVYDMDACFRGDNMIKYILKENQKSGNNISISTSLFRSLFKNEDFKKRYIKRYKSLKKVELKPRNLKIRLNKYYNSVSLAINHQVLRWHIPESLEFWNKRIQKMKNYFEDRLFNYNQHLKSVK